MPSASSNPRPRIGISTSFEDGEQTLHRAYILAVEEAGGLPVILPLVERPDTLRAIVAELDGLILTGGPAVTIGLIGDLPEDLPPADPVRTEADQRVLDAFLESQKPVLGICYGMQLINARFGGTIYADVQRQLDGAGNHSERRGGPPHPIAVEEASHLHRVLGMPVVEVNTRHVQAVASVGSGLRPSATAPDGIVEAVETPDGVVLGVQFHPERMTGPVRHIFLDLVRRARHATSRIPLMPP